MKFKTVAFLLITIIAIINSFAQEEIFFDCVPVDYNSTPKEVKIYNKWLHNDNIVLVADTELYPDKYEVYYVDKGKATFLFQSSKSFNDEIITTSKGFFLINTNLDIIRFYDLTSNILSQVIDTLGTLTPLFYKNKVYEEGFFYLPSDAHIEEKERIGRLHYTEGTRESTFYFKEFKGYSRHSSAVFMSIIKCGDRFFSTGRAEGEEVKSLWELDIHNRKATKIGLFDINAELFCNNDEQVYFLAAGNIGYFDLRSNQHSFLLADTLAASIFFPPEMVDIYSKYQISQSDQNIFDMNFSAEDIQFFKNLSSVFRNEFLKGISKNYLFRSGNFCKLF